MVQAQIIKFAIKALNNPKTKAIAQRLLKKARHGDVAGVQTEMTAIQAAKNFGKKKFNQGIARVKGLTTMERAATKNVNIRKELYYNPHTQTAGTGYFGGFKRTPMLDIDLPGASHYAANVVHASKDKAIKNLMKFLKTPEGKKSLFAAYDTPGGIRLWDLSRRMTPKKFYKTNISKKLGDDPAYGKFNLQRGNYATRLSPKPGRPDDKVASFVDYFGSGQAIPRNVVEVRKYHDNLIKRILQSSTKENINMGGMFDLIGK